MEKKNRNNRIKRWIEPGLGVGIVVHCSQFLCYVKFILLAEICLFLLLWFQETIFIQRKHFCVVSAFFQRMKKKNKCFHIWNFLMQENFYCRPSADLANILFLKRDALLFYHLNTIFDPRLDPQNYSKKNYRNGNWDRKMFIVDFSNTQIRLGPFLLLFLL